MSKPNIDGLGVCAELTLHEKALRKAQHEIDEMRAENARLREELRIARAGTKIDFQSDRIHLCGDPLLRQQQAMAPIMSSFEDERRTAYLAQNPSRRASSKL